MVQLLLLWLRLLGLASVLLIDSLNKCWVVYIPSNWIFKLAYNQLQGKGWLDLDWQCICTKYFLTLYHMTWWICMYTHVCIHSFHCIYMSYQDTHSAIMIRAHLHLFWCEVEREECQQPLKLRFSHTTCVPLTLHRNIITYSACIHFKYTADPLGLLSHIYC